MNEDSFNIKDEWKKARRFFSDSMNEQTAVQIPRTDNSPKGTISYGEVVRELLNQINNGCDIIPITSEFSFEDLMQWVKSHAVGNQLIIINDSLHNTTGQILSVIFAQDNIVLLAKDKPKVCFVYQTLNTTISDLFPNGTKAYIKPIKIV